MNWFSFTFLNKKEGSLLLLGDWVGVRRKEFSCNAALNKKEFDIYVVHSTLGYLKNCSGDIPLLLQP